MRTVAIPAVLVLALAAPAATDAQVYRYETPPPAVTAANAPWQAAGEPVFFAGNFYYPAGATVFFDGKVMVRTGVYEGIPLYADVTLEPYSIVYVPIGGALMQPYERRREGELAGTVGSRTPSFPIQRDVEASAAFDAWGDVYAYPPSPVAGVAPVMRTRPARPIARPEPDQAAAEEPFTPVGSVMISPMGVQNRPSPMNYGNGSLPSTGSDASLWISYQNARWYAAGRAVPFDAARFEPAGTYDGFPVYRERGGSADRIFVTTVRNGPVAPFERR